MPNQRDLKGTVVDRAGNRYKGAVLQLSKKDVPEELSTTNDEGDFNFDLGDTAKWPAGEYSLEVLHRDLLPLERKVQLETGKPPDFLWLNVLNKGQASDKAGWAFLAVMFALVGALMWGYFYLHEEDESNRPPPVNVDLSLMVETARGLAKNTSSDQLQATIGPVLTTTSRVFEDLVKANQDLFSEEKQVVVRSLLVQAQNAVTTNNEGALTTVLDKLDTALRHEQSGFFWEYYPKRSLEVLFWALAATLIRLAFNAGGYLKHGNFHSRAIPHHLALIVTAPILAVLIAFVLSLVNISIGLSDLELSLDMSNVTISILVGALIGLAPWKAWDFMQQLADLLFTSLGKLTKGQG